MSVVCPEDESSMILQIAGIYLQVHLHSHENIKFHTAEPLAHEPRSVGVEIAVGRLKMK
jgi:hypothetical protein